MDEITDSDGIHYANKSFHILLDMTKKQAQEKEAEDYYALIMSGNEKSEVEIAKEVEEMDRSMHFIQECGPGMPKSKVPPALPDEPRKD